MRRVRDLGLAAIGVLLAGCSSFRAAPSSERGCDDTCRHARDGECDDGGPGSASDLCALGTDCGDCGPRSRGGPTPAPAPPTDAGGPAGCSYPATYCAPIGCVSGGRYCCRFSAGANGCAPTYEEAERLCASTVYDCSAGRDDCPDGHVLISWDDAPAICSAICTSDAECPTRNCRPTSLGVSACAPEAGSACSPRCGGDEICVLFEDGSAACGARCSTGADCASGCCGPLEGGGSACMAARHCPPPTCVPSCGGRACGDDDGCGGTCMGSCGAGYLECVLHRSGFHYCADLCERHVDCCESAPRPGAVREGRWCCVPGSMSGSGLPTCGYADGVCPWFSEDICPR